MADEDLEAIRARRMAELQAQYEVSGARPASSGTYCDICTSISVELRAAVAPET